MDWNDPNLILSLMCLLVHTDTREESQARNAATRIIPTLGFKRNYSRPLVTWKVILPRILSGLLLWRSKGSIYKRVTFRWGSTCASLLCSHSCGCSAKAQRHCHLRPSPRALSYVTPAMYAGSYHSATAVSWVHSCLLSGHLLAWSWLRFE